MSFQRLDPEDFVVSADPQQSTAWSTGQPTLNTFFSSSIQQAGSTGKFYLSVYQTGSTLSNAAVQFDIVYGDKVGSGSLPYNTILPFYTPTSTIYGSYRSLVLEDETSDFVFGAGTNTYTSPNFYALSIERSRYKEKLFPGTFNMVLSGSGGKLYLTDNSKDVLTQTFLGSTRVLQVISGSNGSSYSGSDGYLTNSGSYGLFLPEIGTIMLNPTAVGSIGLNASRSSGVDDNNERRIYNSLNLGASFQLNSDETITSDYIFVNTKASQFNYSSNPSFISGSTGEIIYSEFINNPQVYITTVGLYNDSNELLAVAKLSRPLLNDFTKALLVRAKLDF